jgi:hypothetical protein
MDVREPEASVPLFEGAVIAKVAREKHDPRITAFIAHAAGATATPSASPAPALAPTPAQPASRPLRRPSVVVDSAAAAATVAAAAAAEAAAQTPPSPRNPADGTSDLLGGFGDSPRVANKGFAAPAAPTTPAAPAAASVGGDLFDFSADFSEPASTPVATSAAAAFEVDPFAMGASVSSTSPPPMQAPADPWGGMGGGMGGGGNGRSVAMPRSNSTGAVMMGAGSNGMGGFPGQQGQQGMGIPGQPNGMMPSAYQQQQKQQKPPQFNAYVLYSYFTLTHLKRAPLSLSPPTTPPLSLCFCRSLHLLPLLPL